MSDKIPFNIEAEQAVLGAILIADKNMNVIDDINLRVDDFYRPSHKIIYKAMLTLFKANKPIDNLTVIEYLDKTNKLEEAGGIACITSLVNCVPSASNVKYYADMVKDTAIRRKYIQAGEQIKDIAYTAENIDSAVSEAYGVPEGVLVRDVTEGGAAEDAGIKEKSIITEFDGKRVRSIDELVSRLEYYEPGEEVEVTLEVADGGEYKEKTVTVTLGENKDTDSNKDSKDDSKDESDAEDSQDQGDGEDQSTDSLLQDFENQESDGTAYEQFFGFLN